SKLAQDFVVNAFRRLVERRRWSWLTKFGQLTSTAVYSTGTVTVTQNSTTVTGSGTGWTSALVGQQFRIGSSTPIYTISTVTSTTQLDLDSVWGGTTASAQTYSIYTCYFPVPSDFKEFICLWDVAFNWQLILDIQQNELNMIDAQRASVGNPYVVSFRDYTTSQVGVVGASVQIVGSGAVPTSGGTYTAPANAIFTIVITTGGASGTAVFKWSKNNGTYTTGVTTSTSAITLQDGVTVAFPTGTYVINDTFIISTTSIPNAGVARVELYPHIQSAKVFPFLYSTLVTDLNDSNAVIPRSIQGNFLVDLALEDVAMWPGPSPDKKNIYFSRNTAEYYRVRNERQMIELERADDNIW